MLKSIRIQNFKSYKDATFELSPFTVLIGANASGKSNAIEALRFMSILAQGQKLSSFNYNVLNKSDGIRGDAQSLFFNDQSEIRFSCKFDDLDYDTLDMNLVLREDELHISNETITNDEKFLYEIKERNQGSFTTDVSVVYNNFTKGKQKPSIPCSDQRAIFCQLTSPASLAEKYVKSREVIPSTCSRIEEELSSMFFLDPVPAKMRDYCARDKRLSSSGDNLSGVINNLTKNFIAYSIDELKRNAKALMEFVKDLPEQNFKGIRFLREPKGKYIVALRESFGGIFEDRDASLLSDGTLRVLAIAVAMLSSPPNSMVVIEEIDNGIHPSRVKRLLFKIYKLAQERHLQMLITTHNPILLDALPDDIVRNSVYCYRDNEYGASNLVKISDLPNYFDLLIQGSLGDLLVSERISNFVKNAYSGKKEADYVSALQWIEDYKKGF